MFQDLNISCINHNWLVEILAEIGTIYSDNDKENNNNNNDYLPTVEEILYTTLHKEGFAIEDSSPDHTVILILVALRSYEVTAKNILLIEMGLGEWILA